MSNPFYTVGNPVAAPVGNPFAGPQAATPVPAIPTATTAQPKYSFPSSAPRPSFTGTVPPTQNLQTPSFRNPSYQAPTPPRRTVSLNVTAPTTTTTTSIVLQPQPIAQPQVSYPSLVPVIYPNVSSRSSDSAITQQLTNLIALLTEESPQTFTPTQITDHKIHAFLAEFIKFFSQEILKGEKTAYFIAAESWINELIGQVQLLPGSRDISFSQLRTALQYHFYNQLSSACYAEYSQMIIGTFEMSNKVPNPSRVEGFEQVCPLRGYVRCPLEAQEILSQYKSQLSQKLKDAALKKLTQEFQAGTITSEKFSGIMAEIAIFLSYADTKSIVEGVISLQSKEIEAEKKQWFASRQSPETIRKKAEVVVAAKIMLQTIDRRNNISQNTPSMSSSNLPPPPVYATTTTTTTQVPNTFPPPLNPSYYPAPVSMPPFYAQPIATSAQPAPTFNSFYPTQGSAPDFSPSASVDLNLIDKFDADAKEKEFKARMKELETDLSPLSKALKKSDSMESFDFKNLNDHPVHKELQKIVGEYISQCTGDVSQQIQMAEETINDIISCYRQEHLNFHHNFLKDLSGTLRNHFYVGLFNKIKKQIIENFEKSSELPKNLKELTAFVTFLKKDPSWDDTSQEFLEEELRIDLAKALFPVIAKKCHENYVQGKLTTTNLELTLKTLQKFKHPEGIKQFLESTFAITPQHSFEQLKEALKLELNPPKGWFSWGTTPDTPQIIANRKKTVTQKGLLLDLAKEKIEKAEKEIQRAEEKRVILARKEEAKSAPKKVHHHPVYFIESQSSDPLTVWASLTEMQKKDILRHAYYKPKMKGTGEDAVKAFFSNKEKLKKMKNLYSPQRIQQNEYLHDDFALYTRGENILDMYYSSTKEDYMDAIESNFKKFLNNDRFLKFFKIQLEAASFDVSQEVYQFRNENQLQGKHESIERNWLQQIYNEPQYLFHAILALEMYLHTTHGR